MVYDSHVRQGTIVSQAQQAHDQPHLECYVRIEVDPVPGHNLDLIRLLLLMSSAHTRIRVQCGEEA
jgi:hypothetical protein